MLLAFNVLAYFIATLFFDISFSLNLLLLPLLIIQILVFTLGISLTSAVMFTYFNDIKHIIGVSLIFGFWTSGVFIPTHLIADKWPIFYKINPFLGIFENIRNLILINADFNWYLFKIDSIICIVTLIIGVFMLKMFSHKVVEKL
jgi:ABC-type polysaccharide/polyol phosphate export permease